MTEERSKRREFLPLVFIVNCFKKPMFLRTEIRAYNSLVFSCRRFSVRELSAVSVLSF